MRVRGGGWGYHVDTDICLNTDEDKALREHYEIWRRVLRYIGTINFSNFFTDNAEGSLEATHIILQSLHAITGRKPRWDSKHSKSGFFLRWAQCILCWLWIESLWTSTTSSVKGAHITKVAVASVKSAFLWMNVQRRTCPDEDPGRLIKTIADQREEENTDIFKLSKLHLRYTWFKKTTIIPVLKRLSAVSLNK